MTTPELFADQRLMPTDEEFYSLNEFIEAHFGLTFAEHKRGILAGKLRPRIRALHLTSFKDYYLRLQANLDDEVALLAVLVTNNETYLCRERNHFDALLSEGIPMLRQNLVVPGSLRVLCAGCSSGEEPHTMNFYLRRADVRLGGLEPHVDAFDIDSTRVEMARGGSYRTRSVREMTEEQIRRYLTQTEPDRYEVKSLYRKGVTFSSGNIVDVSSFRHPLAYDVLFCRNVLIYFSDRALRAAIDNFGTVLRPGGLLFLGHSESIIGLSSRFETVHLGRSIVYRKVGP